MPMRNEKTIAAFSDVSLAVLAGGAGSRMGIAKSYLQLSGKPILSWLMEKIDWPGPTILVTANCNQNPPGYDAFTKQAIDEVDREGPLRGVYTALNACETSFLCITTVDMPMVRQNLLFFLASQLKRHTDAAGVMLKVNSSTKSRIEPFPAAFRKSSLNTIRDRLNSGMLSVQKLLELNAFLTMESPEDATAETWTNLNYQKDLSDFKHKYGI